MLSREEQEDASLNDRDHFRRHVRAGRHNLAPLVQIGDKESGKRHTERIILGQDRDRDPGTAKSGKFLPEKCIEASH